MSNLKEAASRVAILKTIRDAVDAEYENARKDAFIAFAEAKKDTGAKTLDVTIPDTVGTKVGALSLTETTDTVQILDERAFTDWVADAYPTEVYTVTRVRESWLKGFLAALQTDFDPKTGEKVPGVRLTKGGQPKGIALRLTKGAREAIVEAWQGGRLPVSGFAPRALTPTPEPDLEVKP